MSAGRKKIRRNLTRRAIPAFAISIGLMGLILAAPELERLKTLLPRQRCLVLLLHRAAQEVLQAGERESPNAYR